MQTENATWINLGTKQFFKKPYMGSPQAVGILTHVYIGHAVFHPPPLKILAPTASRTKKIGICVL